jgi:hypothetical protein
MTGLSATDAQGQSHQSVMPGQYAFQRRVPNELGHREIQIRAAYLGIAWAIAGFSALRRRSRIWRLGLACVGVFIALIWNET